MEIRVKLSEGLTRRKIDTSMPLMMTSNVTITVLISVLISAVLVCVLYGIHAHIIPHLRRPKERPDITVPQRQTASDPRLQATLYSAPSPNFLDPRNSITDSDLRSSRWSTNLRDLSPPSSPMSVRLPRSPKMHFTPPSRHSTISQAQSRRHSRPTPFTHHSMPSPKSRKIEQTPKHTRQTISDPAYVSNEAYENLEKRHRSKSDPQGVIPVGMLAQSHAAFYGQNAALDFRSPTSSTWSGNTLHFRPRSECRVLSYGSRKSSQRTLQEPPKRTKNGASLV